MSTQTDELVQMDFGELELRVATYIEQGGVFPEDFYETFRRTKDTTEGESA
jgi:hypothetical protein